MQVLILNQHEIRQLLPMNECIDVMAQALTALAQGKALQPLRPMMPVPNGRGLLAMMPAYLGEPAAIGLKVITVFPGNEGTPFDSHQGAVLLFESEHGSLRAILDATEITAIRTAAVSGVATRLLARENAGDLALIGSGVQAGTHLEAMQAVRRIRRVRVWSPSVAHVHAFTERESGRRPFPVVAAGSAQEAVDGADIVCTVTSSTQSVLRREWIAPGAHINAVGASRPDAREIDTDTIAQSRLFVDRRESALNEAGDFLIPRQEGAIDDSHIAGELGDLLLGSVTGRISPEEVTLFKSLGLSVEDAAAAQYVYDEAVASGVGALIELGGSRSASG
jgi:ornithine cyclodeaminase